MVNIKDELQQARSACLRDLGHKETTAFCYGIKDIEGTTKQVHY